MIALCQLTFAAVGAWIVSLLNVMQAPGGFVVWLVLGGIAAGLVGVLVGLPALRLRGVNLAVVTLGFAAAADVTLVQIQFPGSADGTAIERPAMFSNDRQFFFLSIVVLALCALAVFFLQRSRWGSSWKAVAFSERGTAAAGQSVQVAKLTAFAVSRRSAASRAGCSPDRCSSPSPRASLRSSRSRCMCWRSCPARI